MSLISVSDNEIVAGKSREAPGGENRDDSRYASEDTLSDPALADKTGARFTFDDMKLRVEDRLQLEAPDRLGGGRFPVKLVGFLKGASLLVTTPITAKGIRLPLLESEKVIMRSFCGQNAFAFTCTLKRTDKITNEYLHLSFPENIDGRLVRKAPRIKTSIIAAIQDGEAGTTGQISALISDISAKGVSLEAKRQLGGKGDILNMAFRVQLHEIEAFLSVRGVVRTALSGDAADSSKSGLIRHGIEFQDLQPNDSMILQSMIYQQLIENPHRLM